MRDVIYEREAALISATSVYYLFLFFFFQAEDGIRDLTVTGVQTCALPISDLDVRPFGLKQLAPKAERAHVKIGCENCNSEQRFLLSPREFWVFLNDVEIGRASCRERV